MDRPTPTKVAVEQFARYRTWYFVLGLMFIVAGVFVIAMPLVTRVTLTVIMGLPLIVLGATRLVHAYGSRGTHGAIPRFVSGLVELGGGIAIVAVPIVADFTLSIVLAGTFVTTGLVQVLLGFSYRPHTGWRWFVAAGVVAMIVALEILLTWPLAGFAVSGILIGVSLIASGGSYVALAFGAKRLNRPD